MRHKAPRPFVDWWHRLPRTTARLLGEAAEHRPFHALAAVMVTLSLGAGAYVAITSVSGGSSNRPTASAGSTAPRDSEWPHPTDEMPASDGRTVSGGSSDPEASATGRPEAPVAATSVPPSVPTKLGVEKERPSTGTATPSASPSQQSPSPSQPSPSPSQPSPSPSRPSAEASITAEDVTPPNTSLSEEFPEPDAGEFWPTANEPASFTCSLDGAAFTPCDSPTRYSDLDPGWHTLAVRATDAAGNTDPSPAETRWHASGGRSTDD